MHPRTKGVLVAATAIALAFLTGPGTGPSPVAPLSVTTLDVECHPPADLWVDGLHRGLTPVSLDLTGGLHEVALRRRGFEEHHAQVSLEGGEPRHLEIDLIAQDPEDPEVLTLLARRFDVDFEPFVAPPRHRGRAGAAEVVLLWPQRDVRLEGLLTYALEVTEEYEGDAWLEFRRGRTVLHRERFDPETMTTVAALPSAVTGAVEVGDTVTWGLDFDGSRRRDVWTRFEVVSRPKVERRLARMATDRHLARQEPIARSLLIAKTLENHRLYTEALLASLAVARENPDSVRPFETIVTSLRRLDGEDSRLWAVASQFVSGRGQARTAAGSLVAFAPPVPVLVPPSGATPVASATPSSSSPRPGGAMGPGTTGTPPAGPTPPAAAPPVAEPGRAAGERARLLDLEAREAERMAAGAVRHAEEAQRGADLAGDEARNARRDAEAAAAALEAAEQAHAESPGPETEEALRAAREAASAAAEIARQAERAAEEIASEAQEAREAAAEAERRAEALTELAEEARRAAEAAGVRIAPPVPAPDPERPDPAREREEAMNRIAERFALYQDAEQSLVDARARFEELEATVAEGQEPLPREELEAARVALEEAEQALREAEEALRAAEAELLD